MTTESLTFADLGLPQPILDAVNEMGFVNPSPIQQECIPHLLAGRDVLGMAQPGAVKPPHSRCRCWHKLTQHNATRKCW